MSHSGQSLSTKDVLTIVEYGPLRVPTYVNCCLLAVAFFSFSSFVCSVLFGEEAALKSAWLSFHVNFLYWFSLSAAGACFTAVFHICNAEWVRPVRRIFESAAPFFTVSVLAIIVLFFGKEHLFPWAVHSIAGKEIWLDPVFVYSRDFLALALLAGVALVTVFLSVRRDTQAIRSQLVEVSSAGLANWGKRGCSFCFAGGEDEAAALKIAKCTALLGRFSPAVIILYAVVMTLISFDQIMSVEPHWFSTLFGAMFFMSSVYLAVAWVAISTVFLSRNRFWQSFLLPSVLHDLGKLLFGFGIFWAYMFWSHYLTIWYGNIPHETSWVITRMREEPWHGFAWLTFALCFVIPFLLGLNRDLKQIPLLLALTGAIVAVGIWLQYYLLFVPGVSPNFIPLTWRDPVIFVGFGSLFLFFSLRFLSKMPLVPFGDMYGHK